VKLFLLLAIGVALIGYAMGYALAGGLEAEMREAAEEWEG
jgi:hypothetical protein